MSDLWHLDPWIAGVDLQGLPDSASHRLLGVSGRMLDIRLRMPTVRCELSSQCRISKIWPGVRGLL